mmetsp:Transcript_30227/g.58079  ORF Transcript_30227/g.58079 Transcript_30227/m.58079 type:complete len:244 (+) Transcript_30227:218-949(+)
MQDNEQDYGEGEELPVGASLQLVLSYCVHHCYTDTVRVLENSCSLPRNPELHPRLSPARSPSGADVAFDDAQHRAPICNHVLQGNVHQAVELTNKCAPGMLSSFEDVHFDLLTIHFAQLVKKENALEALRFARTELSPFAAKASTADIKDAILDKLQDLVTLLAYEDPSASPVGELLTEEYRRCVAEKVNRSLLLYTHRPSQAPLERLLQHTIVARQELANVRSHSSPPSFNLREDVKHHCAL